MERENCQHRNTERHCPQVRCPWINCKDCGLGWIDGDPVVLRPPKPELEETQ